MCKINSNVIVFNAVSIKKKKTNKKIPLNGKVVIGHKKHMSTDFFIRNLSRQPTHIRALETSFHTNQNVTNGVMYYLQII